MIVLLWLAQTAVAAPAFWPVTVAGWITLAASTAALGYAVYDRIWAKAKRDAELNGYGKRVGDVEDWQRRFDAGATERALLMERITVSQEKLFTQLGMAEEKVTQCHTDIDRLGRELVEKMDGMLDNMRAWERRTTLAAHGLEVELRARGILAAQPPAPPAMPLPLERDR